MLAYSSISQMGYIVMALGGQPGLGIVGGGRAFLQPRGLQGPALRQCSRDRRAAWARATWIAWAASRSRMPVTGGHLGRGQLSIAGLPPLAGFWSKLLIVIALWKAGQQVFAVIAILTSLVTLAYFLSLQRRVFFGKILPEWEGVHEAGARLLVPALPWP